MSDNPANPFAQRNSGTLFRIAEIEAAQIRPLADIAMFLVLGGKKPEKSIEIMAELENIKSTLRASLK